SNAAAWSWFTGWFNLLGQIAVTAGIDFGGAFFVTAFLNLQFGYPIDPPHIIGVYAVILLLHGLLNTFGVRLVALLNDISVWWHVLGVAIIVAVLAIVPAHHQSVSFVFTKLVNNTGWGSSIYVFALVLLLIVIGAQFFCGMSSVTANSRMIYAFSRDGALPGSNFWHKVNKRTRTPTNSIWFAAVGALILGLPYLWNPEAYAAVTSIAV